MGKGTLLVKQSSLSLTRKLKNAVPLAATRTSLLDLFNPVAVQTWKVPSAPVAGWQGVPSSEDGRNLVAAQ